MCLNLHPLIAEGTACLVLKVIKFLYVCEVYRAENVVQRTRPMLVDTIGIDSTLEDGVSIRSL